MKIAKITVFLLVAIFLFSAADLCATAYSADDGDHHCSTCCNSVCHAMFLSGQNSIELSLYVSSSLIQSDAVLRQEPNLDGIEYPPNSII